jgi:uncharacterized repeat protein (TIGR01451 family)
MAVAVAATAAVSGCGIDKADEHARQLDAIGDVVVQTTFCTSGDVDGDSHACAPFERAHRGQALVAYRIPDGSEAPESFEDDNRRLEFTRNAGYGAYMQENHARARMHWVGYASDPYALDAGAQAAFTVSPQFTLPDAGKPFVGPYRYRVEGGYRELTTEQPDGDAPIDCEHDLTTDCVSAAVVGDDSALATRDLGVLAGGDAPSVDAGASVPVPFDLRYAGAAVDAAQFSLSASTDLDGASVALSRDALHPASDSDSAVTAVVSVPATATPGTYEVRLAATAAGGSDVVIFRAGRAEQVLARAEDRTQRRAGVMRFRVEAPRHHDPDPAPRHHDPDPPPPVTPQATATDDPPPSPVPVPPAPAPSEPPPVPRPPAVHRAVLGLSLTALPRRAYTGEYASYLVVAHNRSALVATGLRVCQTLPGQVQFVEATRRVRFAGRRLCFRHRRLASGGSVAALVHVHVDTDARPGMARARATASAANANLARARAQLRVLRREADPRPAPVTG